MKYSVKQCCKILNIVLIASLLFIGSLFGQEATGEYPPNSSANILSLNFKDTDIRDVFRAIAYEYHTNIVVDNMVAQKVSVALFNVTVFNAVRIISEDNGLEFSFDAQRFIIKPYKKKEPLPPPVPPEQEPEISYNKRMLSISLNNVEIQKVVDALTKETGRNFLLTNGTSGRLSGKLNNVEFETGLRNILQNNGFYLLSKDSIFYISRSAYYSSLDSNGVKNKSAYWVFARHNKITIDVNQADLERIIDDIANQINLQLVRLSAITGQVTLKCSEVPLEKAFEYLFKGTEFTYTKDGNAYIIGSKTSKSLDKTKLIRINYLRADKVKETLPQGILQGISVSTSLEHNALLVTGQAEGINNLEDYISALDRPVPQVMIEALVVDYNLDKQLQYGINVGKGDSSYLAKSNKYFPGLDATIGGKRLNEFLNRMGTVKLFGKDIDMAKLGKLPDDFYVNLKALQENGIANVKSKPLLSSLNGHTASLKIGTVQNYVFSEIMPVTNQLSSTYLEKETIQKIEANISFEITPWIGANNELTLEIKPEFQTPEGEFVPDKNLIPAINTRSFFSTIRIKDGETIVLGGLIQESETNTEDKFPILGDIPIIGSFFTSVSKVKSKGELVIYITPKIYYGDDFGNQYYNYSN
jgi:type IV pilus assembly protein PilQ